MIEDLITSLETLYSKSKYEEVIRLGTALDRPLFESGHFMLRFRIGVIVEKAAAVSGNRYVQALSRIDSIGWSSVELGKYDKARREIEIGLNIASDLENWQLCSKGARHLGVICRKQGKYQDALNQYEQAEKYAQNIQDQEARAELQAGIDYAKAHVFAAKGNLEDAIATIDSAINKFQILNNAYKITMSVVYKGKILCESGKMLEAKDVFRRALELSEARGQRLHSARAHIGLAKIYIHDLDWQKAKSHISSARSVALQIGSEAELREVGRLEAMTPD